MASNPVNLKPETPKPEMPSTPKPPTPKRLKPSYRSLKSSPYRPLYKEPYKATPILDEKRPPDCTLNPTYIGRGSVAAEERSGQVGRSKVRV